MFDWKSVSEDPNDRRLINTWLANLKEIEERITFKSDLEREKFIADRLCHHDGAAILDVGFIGHAVEFLDDARWFHRHLRQHSARNEIWGLDLNEKMCEHIKSTFKWDNIIAGNAETASFPDNYFDRIHAGDLIEHLSNIGLFLDNMRKSLKHDGLLFVSTPNPLGKYRILRHFRLDASLDNFEHVCYIIPTNMNELARRHGFSLEKVLLLSSNITFDSQFTKLLFLCFSIPFKLLGHNSYYDEYLYVLRKR